MGFVIKKTVTATEEHPTRSGEVMEFILIKGGYVRYPEEPVYGDQAYKTRAAAERVAKGYKELDAQRAYEYSYTEEYEIIEVQGV